MNEHTPGPWTAVRKQQLYPDDSYWAIEAYSPTLGEQVVADTLNQHHCIESGDGNTEEAANARLMAAAPDLLAALEAILADPDMANMFETAAHRLGIYEDTSIPEFNRWCKATEKLAADAKAAIMKARKP
jgi:hypothetical protein